MDLSNVITIVPVLLVVIVIVFEKLRQKKIRNEYDEMQLEIRGRGAWYGFYAMILYWALILILENTAGFRFLSAGNAVFLGIMISGSVLVGYNILHDSYYGLNQTRSRTLYFICIITAIEAMCIAYLTVMIRGGVFSDLTKPCGDSRLMLIMCIPMFTTILVTTLFRHLKREQEEA